MAAAARGITYIAIMPPYGSNLSYGGLLLFHGVINRLVNKSRCKVNFKACYIWRHKEKPRPGPKIDLWRAFPVPAGEYMARKKPALRGHYGGF